MTPATGLEIGSSFSRGAFLGRRALTPSAGTTARHFVQRAHGVDAEYRARPLAGARRGGRLSEWRIPTRRHRQGRALRALAISVEARYALLPGVYAAARVEHLAFNRIAGARRDATWDAPVTRGRDRRRLLHPAQRRLHALSLQLNDRDGGRITSDGLPPAQLLFWF